MYSSPAVMLDAQKQTMYVAVTTAVSTKALFMGTVWRIKHLKRYMNEMQLYIEIDLLHP